MPADDTGRAARRGRPPRHTVDELVRTAVSIADADGLDAVTIRAVAARLGAGAMSLYSYLPDKQALIQQMVELVGNQYRLVDGPTGDWRADLRRLALQRRAMMHRHPWLLATGSQRLPPGPAALDHLEFGLGALEPTGLDARSALETVALLTDTVSNLVRAELGDAGLVDDEGAAPLGELLDTGRYPRFAAAMAARAEPEVDPEAEVHFERLIDRLLNGLVRG
jgi:AcrR family transcriptional regulator